MTAMIDWLTVYQDHPGGGLPEIGDMVVERMDIETGALVSRTITGYQHPGSYDSSLRVRCDGTRVEVSGNPSRFDRPDNLWGFLTMWAAVEVYNIVLRSLGLPEFTAADNVHPIQRQSGAGGVVLQGARVTRVDLCQLYAVGPGNERLFMKWAAARSLYGEPGKLYPDGNTVTWHEGSKRLLVKYYAKGPELQRGLIKRMDGCEYTEISDGGYRGRLAAWCIKHGVVRHEITLRSRQLEREGLQTLNGWDIEQMGEIMNRWNIGEDVSAGVGSYSEVADTLMSQGVKRATACSAQGFLYAWLAGEHLKEKMSKSSWYRLRRLLLGVGVDISHPSNVQMLNVRVREIELRPLDVSDAPAWYRWPKVA